MKSVLLWAGLSVGIILAAMRLPDALKAWAIMSAMFVVTTGLLVRISIGSK